MSESKVNCPCKRACVRHADCFACRKHHETLKHAPACDRIRQTSIRKQPGKQKPHP